jgi:hypothetical protein
MEHLQQLEVGGVGIVMKERFMQKSLIIPLDLAGNVSNLSQTPTIAFSKSFSSFVPTSDANLACIQLLV